MMKTISILACLVLFTVSNKVIAQRQETRLVVIAAPHAVIPQNLGDDLFDEKIKNLKESLPAKLETLIFNFGNGEIQFLESELLMELIDVLNYEEPRGFIDAINDSLKERINAVLLTKIEKVGASQITIKAKIVHIDRRILVVKDKTTYLEPQQTFDLNLESLATEIVNELIPKKCGLVSLKEYIKGHGHYTIGIGVGLGYRKGDQVTLGNVPRDSRTVPPHPDDVKYRSGDILDPNIPDNYLIRENTVYIDLGHRKSLDMHFSFWSVINIMVRTSAIGESEVVENQNLFRKNYIKPGITGEALIFYSVKSKKRQFFDGNSFSLPIYITYPVLYCGKSKGLVFRILGGTNILLPDKIELVADQGWDRFGEKEIKETIDLGKLKEIEWFGGIDIEGSPAKDFRLGIQFTLVYTDYLENREVPLSLQLESSVRPSLRVTATKLFRK
jgi:hypothetical protein